MLWLSRSRSADWTPSAKRVEAQRRRRSRRSPARARGPLEIRSRARERLRRRDADEAGPLRAGALEDDAGAVGIGAGEGRPQLDRRGVVVLGLP